jgi:hypothetical protein
MEGLPENHARSSDYHGLLKPMLKTQDVKGWIKLRWLMAG